MTRLASTCSQASHKIYWATSMCLRPGAVKPPKLPEPQGWRNRSIWVQQLSKQTRACRYTYIYIHMIYVYMSGHTNADIHRHACIPTLQYHTVRSNTIQYKTIQYKTLHTLHYTTFHCIVLHYMNTYIGVCSIVSVHTLAFQVACPCAWWVLVTEFNFMVT